MKVILYISDALRADHTSLLGYERETTPHLERLEDNILGFNNAHSHATWTRASAGSILTGLYPPTVGLEQIYDGLPEDIPTLPRMLSSMDITTIGISAMGNVSSAFGFDKHFDKWIDLYKHPELINQKETITQGKLFLNTGEEGPVVNPTSIDINDFLFPVIKEHKNEDVFIFVWSIDPHDPYDPLPEYRQYSGDQDYTKVAEYGDLNSAEDSSEIQWIRDRYDDLILQNDSAIGEIGDLLRQLEVSDETLLLIAGDHGEAFGEHSVYGHNTIPFEEVINVPILVHNENLSGEVTDELVGHIDILPTVLDWFDASEELDGPGESLLSDDRGHEKLYSRTKSKGASPEYRSVTSKKWKYIQIDQPTVRHASSAKDMMRRLRTMFQTWRVDRRQLYRRSEGGGSKGYLENENLADVQPQVRRKLANEAQQWYINSSRGSWKQTSKSIDEATQEQLRKMGYID